MISSKYLKKITDLEIENDSLRDKYSIVLGLFTASVIFNICFILSLILG
jgi:hypothetical protein